MDIIDRMSQRMQMRDGGVSLLAGISIFLGVHLYGIGKEKHDETTKVVATSLFVLGWLLQGLAASGGLQMVQLRGCNRIKLGLVSVTLVIVGAIMSRQALDKHKQPNNAYLAMFLLGWLGFGSTIAWRGSPAKMALTAVAVVTTLGGVMYTRKLESDKKDVTPGRAVFGVGWVLIALAIGLRI